MKGIFKVILKSVLFFILFIACYFIFAFIFSIITVNRNFSDSTKESIDIYLLSNGVHADVVVPYRSELKDWSTLVRTTDTQVPDYPAEYVAFGWGDKGFYLETKTWAELKFSTAFKALFFLSSSAMHVTFYQKLSESDRCKKIRINKTEYSKIIEYINTSFKLDGMGLRQHIDGASYSNHDAFYEAHHTYNLFYTCNTWTNKALKSAGLKACLWTPFSGYILDKY